MYPVTLQLRHRIFRPNNQESFERFTAVGKPRYQEMEHSSPPRRSSQTQGDLQAPSGAYSPIQDYIPGQCIAGTGAHRESLHNAQTRDMCICTGMIHPGPWPLHLCKECQSICTDLSWRQSFRLKSFPWTSDERISTQLSRKLKPQ